MQNSPFFWLEYGLMRQQEMIEEAQPAWRACPSTAERLWRRATSRLEKLTLSLGLHWQVAYTPACSRG